MLFKIYKQKEPVKVIRMGFGPVVIDLDQPPVETKQGRVKKMSEEKKLGHETGVKKIHEEDAGKQGPIGTGNEKAPEAPATGEDVKIGNQEDKANG